MHVTLPPRRCVAAATVVALLGGCADMGPRSHGHGATAGAPASMGSQAEPMDMQAMCERHKQMMAGRSQQEQQALVQQQMMAMSPEMQQRMQAMMRTCR